LSPSERLIKEILKKVRKDQGEEAPEEKRGTVKAAYRRVHLAVG
jgi:hypothetical protein